MYTVKKFMYLIAKSVSKWYPELFLIVSVIIYWALTTTLVNPVAISLVVLLVAQLRFKNKTFGITLSFVFMLLSFYMMLSIFLRHSQPRFFLPYGIVNAWLWNILFWSHCLFCICFTQKKQHHCQ